VKAYKLVEMYLSTSRVGGLGGNFTRRSLYPGERTPVKGTVHPRTGREGPEREQRYNSLSLISAPDGGGLSTSRPGRFTPRKDPVLIV
jgi:hypothetical protein